MPFPARIDPSALGARALEVVERRGWSSWSLRDVAAELQVSPNALYRHVGNREGLSTLAGAAAAAALLTSLRASSRSRRGAPRVQAIARLYVGFAVERPHAYAAFIHAKPASDRPEVHAYDALWRFVRQAVSEAVPHSADAVGFSLWGLLHGRVALALGPASSAPPDAGLRDAVRALLTGFGAGGPVPSPLPPGLRQD